MYLPWPHLTQKFASVVASAPQFEQNIAGNQQLRSPTFEKKATIYIVSSQQPLQEQLVFRSVLPWAIGFAASYLILPRAIWFCRELFGFAAGAIWFCRELSCFAVSYLVLPWTFIVLPRAILLCCEPFRFCRELFDVAVSFYGFAVSYLVLPRTFLVLLWAIWVLKWTIWNCGDRYGPPYN